MGLSTDSIHGGQWKDPLSGAVMVPIYQTSTYEQDELGKHRGYEYARTGNPTRKALEDCVALLENGAVGFAFGSGMAAIQALLTLFKSGDHIVVSANTYGGTFRLFDKILTKWGMSFSYVDTTNVAAIEAAIKKNTKLLFLETPTNPMLQLTDIRAACEVASAHEVLTVVDNTFATPCIQQPLNLGADFVVHSTTKYMNGHSDCVGGVLIAREARWREPLHFVQNSAGAILGPMDSWLTLRGLKTLVPRMRMHQENATLVASHIAGLDGNHRTIFPTLEDFPQKELFLKQMKGPGGIVSVALDHFERAKRFLEGLKLFCLAESLGGVESLACHPASMTHAAVPEKERALLGITDGLVRLSVGLEDVEDLIRDIDQAWNLAH